MTRPARTQKISRRSLLLAVAAAAAGSTAASAAPPADAPMPMHPLPAPAPVPMTEVAVRPVAYWTEVFLQSWDYQYANSLPLSRSADSWDHYNLSYSVDSCVAMFRATGAARYLDRALEFVENVAGSAAPSTSLPHSHFHDSYRGWASSSNGEDGDEIPLYESYFWRYATALLTAVHDAPAIYRDPAYRSRYDRLLDFAETQIFAKWYARGAADYIYRDRTNLVAHWALIATNLALITPDAGRRARYLEVVATVDQMLRRQLRRNPVEATAYFWSDVWGSARRPGQDVSHANNVLAYLAEARDRGTFWSAADMAAFGALLTGVVWPGGRTYRGYVDGTGSDNGWFADGFVKLGRFDPAVQHRLDDHQVINDQFAANMALNARILQPQAGPKEAGS